MDKDTMRTFVASSKASGVSDESIRSMLKLNGLPESDITEMLQTTAPAHATPPTPTPVPDPIVPPVSIEVEPVIPIQQPVITPVAISEPFVMPAMPEPVEVQVPVTQGFVVQQTVPVAPIIAPAPESLPPPIPAFVETEVKKPTSYLGKFFGLIVITVLQLIAIASSSYLTASIGWGTSSDAAASPLATPLFVIVILIALLPGLVWIYQYFFQNKKTYRFLFANILTLVIVGFILAAVR